MKIPVIIVDDEETDRMIVRKRFERSKYSVTFAPFQEFVSGDGFLEDFIDRHRPADAADMPPLVLMDLNMPGRNGFETVEEMSRRISSGETDDTMVVMVFTSSQNQADIDRANALDLVKGYIFKPFDEGDIEMIMDWYEGQTELRRSA